MSTRVSDYDYDLPESCIAQHPLAQRDASKLMVFDRKTGEIHHTVFREIIDHLDSNDVLVFNDSKVIPARIFGHREGKEESVEFLLLGEEDGFWKALVRPGKKAKVGTRFQFGHTVEAEVVEILEDGVRKIRVVYDGVLLERLEEIGTMPLPPYIHEKLEDPKRYQTIYARDPGSAAAPTAGLHFTNALLQALHEKSIQMEYVTLHVGLGTFRPVSVEDARDHHMHSEWYTIDSATAERLNAAKMSGKRIVAVGTTTLRTLESAMDNDILRSGSRSTDIFIYPGYSFSFVDALITNFHLPKSTLLMLVSAFSEREKILHAYRTAVQEGYRFFSFGDAMFLK